MNALFISSYKPFSFSRYLSFCLDSLAMQELRLDQRYKVSFKIFDVTTWLTISRNTRVVQYPRSKGDHPMKFGQLIELAGKIFFFKSNAENEERRLVPDLYLFFEKTLYEIKTNGLQFRFSIVQQPSTWHIMKINGIILQNVDPEIYSI